MALFRRPAAAYEDFIVEVRGDTRAIGGDWYHLMLRASWGTILLLISAIFFALNGFFALAYSLVGGIAGASGRADMFFFSIQTMATIGYGSMYPVSTAAHIITAVEALVGIFFVALSTGVAFSKFSVLRARVRFARHAVVTPMNGVPTLMVRVGHERSSRVLDALTRVVLTRTERTAEGVAMYRMYDLKLERDRAPALSRSWTMLHCITPDSPLYLVTPALAKEREMELTVSLNGIDETSGQTLFAGKTYADIDLRWGARYDDMITERPDGRFLLDMSKFDALLPTKPTEAFPFPQAG